MPFNGSGSFSRVHDWTTDKANLIKITASRVDADSDDFATGLSLCLLRDGQSDTTARIPFEYGIGLADGSVSSPAVNFSNDTNTGIYRIGSDNIGVALGGALAVDLSALGFNLIPAACGVAGDALLSAGVTTGAIYSDFDCKTALKFTLTQGEVQGSLVESGSYRDAAFVQHLDTDGTNYTAIGQRVSHAIRAYTTGKHDGADWVEQYKDLVGGNFVAIGRISWTTRGVSGILAEAIQYGAGIASNEFAVHNPAAAYSQSTSMAAVQGTLYAKKAAADDTHIVRGFMLNNCGKLATSAFEALSTGTDGDNGQFKYGLRMVGAAVTDAAIQMPLSGSGTAGTVIEYDANDYSAFDRASNTFAWVIGGASAGQLASNGINIPTGSFYLVNSTIVVSARQTGWTAMTGTDKRNGFATYTAADISASPTEAEVQAIANAAMDTSRTLKALIDDLMTHGLIGA